MPPKNKKQLEEQQKRLEEQQKRKQQEERRLQQQRKRYAAQIISTYLLLPVSNQLIADFVDHQSSFISDKLKQVISKAYQNLNNEKVLKQVIKQMLYSIKDLRNLFLLGEHSKPQENSQKYFKVRVCCGIYLSVFLNNHPSIQNGHNKNKGEDQNLLRRLLLNHSQAKTQKQQKVFSKQQILSVLSFFKQSYFNHFMILHKHSTFPKRQDEKSFNLYIATPLIEFNTAQTTFIDLSKNKSQDHHSENQDKRSDALQ